MPFAVTVAIHIAIALASILTPLFTTDLSQVYELVSSTTDISREEIKHLVGMWMSGIFVCVMAILSLFNSLNNQ